MPIEFLVGLVGFAGVVIGSVVTHILSKRKTTAEIAYLSAQTRKIENEIISLQENTAELQQTTSYKNHRDALKELEEKITT